MGRPSARKKCGGTAGRGSGRGARRAERRVSLERRSAASDAVLRSAGPLGSSARVEQLEVFRKVGLRSLCDDKVLKNEEQQGRDASTLYRDRLLVLGSLVPLDRVMDILHLF